MIEIWSKSNTSPDFLFIICFLWRDNWINVVLYVGCHFSTSFHISVRFQMDPNIHSVFLRLRENLKKTTVDTTTWKPTSGTHRILSFRLRRAGSMCNRQESMLFTFQEVVQTIRHSWGACYTHHHLGRHTWRTSPSSSCKTTLTYDTNESKTEKTTFRTGIPPRATLTRGKALDNRDQARNAIASSVPSHELR